MATYQVYAYLSGEASFETFQGQAGTGAEAFFKSSRREKRLFLVKNAKEVREGRPFTASLPELPWARFAHAHMESDYVLAYDAKQVKAALFRFESTPEQPTAKQAGKYATLDALSAAIIQAAKKHFPQSYVTARPYKGLGGTNLSVTFALYPKWSHGIIHNDPLHHNWFVYGKFGPEGEILDDRASVELLVGGRLMTTEEDGYKRRTINLRHRNQKTMMDRVPAFFDRYLKRVKQVVVANQEIIPTPN